MPGIGSRKYKQYSNLIRVLFYVVHALAGYSFFTSISERLVVIVISFVVPGSKSNPLALNFVELSSIDRNTSFESCSV